MDGDSNLWGIFAGAATVMWGIAALRVWRAWRTLFWKPAEGVVERASWRLIPAGEDSETHELLISYRYTVNGIPQTAARVAFGKTTFGKQARADAEVALYAPGTRVPVFHHPRDPSDAVLLRQKLGLPTLALVAAGVATLGIGSFLFPASLTP